jgi:FtsP/CotA-like multicopper oxidase with cupredoxin domain
MNIQKITQMSVLTSLLGIWLSNEAISSELFQDPSILPNISTASRIVEVNLEAKVALINVNGVIANLLTYNGSYPAPTIKVKRGDLLRIHFTNSLPATGTNANGHIH